MPKRIVPEIFGSKPELRWVDRKDINVDHASYQRSLQMNRVDRYVKKGFYWGAVKAVSVARRMDGSLWCYDGQNSIAMAEMSGITELPCQVIHLKTIEEEAYLFEIMNSWRSNPTALDKYKAALFHGGSPDAIEVARLIDKLSLNLNAKNSNATSLTCVGVLRNMVNKYSDNVLEQTLDFLIKTFDGEDNNRLQSDLIHGACSFTNQVTKSGQCAKVAWELVAKSGVTSDKIMNKASLKTKSSFKKGATRKTFITEALFELAGA